MSNTRTGQSFAFRATGSQRPDREAGWISPGLLRPSDQRLPRHQLQLADTDLGAGSNRRGRVPPARHRRLAADAGHQLVRGHRSRFRHPPAGMRNGRGLSLAMVPGFHLEGPYICPEDGPRGAHPREHVRDPDLDEFRRWQDAAGGRIRLVTLAPERPGALRFIEAVVASGNRGRHRSHGGDARRRSATPSPPAPA